MNMLNFAGKNVHKRTMDNLALFIKQEHIPPVIATQLRRYFVRCKALHCNHYQQDTLTRMSPYLRGLCSLYTNTRWMLKVPFFRPPPAERVPFIREVAAKLCSTAFPAGKASTIFSTIIMFLVILLCGCR